MTRKEVRERIEEIGIIPGIRVSSADDARFASEAVYRFGIPIAEITMTTPGAIDVISHLAQTFSDMVVGAGTVLDLETAKRCLDAGARFLTSPGLVIDVVDFAARNGVAILPGALTPTEVITAWKAGADLVKIFPCAPLNGHHYIRSLKPPLHHVKLIASGGVNQQTASDFLLAGATALGIGQALMPRDAIRRRREDHIKELAQRFLAKVKAARSAGVE